MAKRPTPPPPQPSQLTAGQMLRAVQILNRRVDDLKAFDPLTASEHDTNALEQSIEATLEHIFGRESSDFRRYRTAVPLDQVLSNL